jgi:hypothetical protein
LAFGADTLDDVEALGAVAFSSVEVVYLVGSALDSADSLVNIIELTCGALSTEVVDKVVAWLADTSALDPVLIYRTNRCTNSIAALSTSLFVAFDTVAALIFLIINLGFRITDTAQSSYEIV